MLLVRNARMIWIIYSHVNNDLSFIVTQLCVLYHCIAFLIAITNDEERRCELYSVHWRVSSRNDSMSMKSHFDPADRGTMTRTFAIMNQSSCPSRILGYAKYRLYIHVSLSQWITLSVINIPNVIPKSHHYRSTALWATKGKTGNQNRYPRTRFTGRGKCGKVFRRLRWVCRRRQGTREGHTGRVNGHGGDVPPPPPPRARKVNVFPAVNTRRAERRPGVGRLVTWSTVNDRESASRMRRYAADPDARNVIATRPFSSILGDPRGPPRGRPAADPHRRYLLLLAALIAWTTMHAFLFFCTLRTARSSLLSSLFLYSFFIVLRHVNCFGGKYVYVNALSWNSDNKICLCVLLYMH